MTGPARSKKPKGCGVSSAGPSGWAMGVIAFVLEKAVMRSVKKGGGAAVEPAPTTITSKGGDAEVQ